MKTLGAIAKAIMEAVGRSAKTEAPYVALLKHTRAKDSTRPAVTQVSARQKPMAASVLLGALFQGPPSLTSKSAKSIRVVDGPS
jgi:hypothetical protein